ncbi:MAG: efflux RND transporter permease subunit [Cyanophyceae cyanobacterium]
MFARWFYRNRQLLILSLTLIFVWGLSSFFTLPRMEDPQIVNRNSLVKTFLPGASAERVESLVTERIEEELDDIEAIAEVVSNSSQGLSIVFVEIKETITDVEPVWSEVRSALEDVIPELPPEASQPEFDDISVTANAALIALTWTLDSPPNYTILSRLAEGLEGELRSLPGTDKVETFGAPQEEIRVEVSATELAKLGLTPGSLAQQIRNSDAKVSAGEFRQSDRQVLLEIDSALESLERVRSLPIVLGDSGQTARLGDVATVEKGIIDPPPELATVRGNPAVVVGAKVELTERVDLWANQLEPILDELRQNLPDGIEPVTLLDQSIYVKERLNGVISNLLVSSGLVIVISLLMLGWKSALIVGMALPLSCLMVFGEMKAFGVPLHQMSVTGLIIALGLLIDNAIVVVDEVRDRLKENISPETAVVQTASHLLVPLLASTLTTVLAFIPIAVAPGGTGEFIGTIGVTVIMALTSSLAISLTIIVAMGGLLSRWNPLPNLWSAFQSGIGHPRLKQGYSATVGSVLRRPWLGVGLALILPVLGFAQFGSLEQQFFPPTNRNQFQVEIEFPDSTGIKETQSQAVAIRDRLLAKPEITEVDWFFGKSAPPFYYNVIETRDNAPNYGQALVQTQSTNGLRDLVKSLQTELDQDFPAAQILVRQLEQGPPIDAPIEVQLYGPDVVQLRELGDRVRMELATIPSVIHTRADLTEARPKFALTIDEVQAKRVGLDNDAIAQQLSTNLDGAVGGSILEDTEDIPVRVKLRDATRQNISQVDSLDIIAPNGQRLPLDAIAQRRLVPDFTTISRKDGQRFNNVQGFLVAGALPDTALTDFKQHLEDIGFELPPGYRMDYGGEADARGTAIANLLSVVGVLLVMMVAILVLSFNSFTLAALIGVVAICGIGLAALALWVFNSLFGFTAILGTLGLVGLAINDSIVVLAALRESPDARNGDWRATREVVVHSTRHVLATTFTTIAGFVPLLLDDTGFWPPLAIAIAGGLGGATILALYFIPSAHLIWTRHQSRKQRQTQPKAMEKTLVQFQ